MEKRAFLAVFLSALVFILYQYFYLSKIDTTQIKPEQIKGEEQSVSPKSPLPPQSELLVKEEVRAEDGLSYQVLWSPGLREDGNSGGYIYEGPTSFINSELVSDKLDKGKQVYHEGDIGWVAIQNKYFMAGLIPVIKENLKAVVKTSDAGDLSAR